MALLGSGVLAIWNGIDPEAEADFVAWHVREHIPERVALAGFLRGRRYVALDGEPAYFNFYETESPAALTMPVYLARLNEPTPWTQRVVKHFRDTSRTVCDVVASLGVGEGGVMETIRLRVPGNAADFAVASGEMLRSIAAAPGVVAVHLLRGRRQDSAGGSAEKALRSQPDEVADWILLIEAVGPEAVKAARGTVASAAALQRCGVAPGCRRGLYRLQFALSRAT
jgi:hypothetical protein